ncbi:MAG: hypothetical protein SH850_26045 [Planctomycetaceae bacterium]|nr:hypothetical protein [Planctomycetaceae bacterium]
MLLRSLMIGVTAFCLLGAQESANAAGPLQGNWNLSCSTISGAAAPFTNSVFAFTQAGTNFQAQNSPPPGQPLCTMLGVQVSTLLVGSEITGNPRNSAGFVIGTVTNNGTIMNMFWFDTLGTYQIRGSKIN